MISLSAPYRRAVPDDARALAELVNIAGEGLPGYLWGKMVEPGVSSWDIGRQRARREVGGFSYRNAVLREHDGRIASALIGYPLDEQPETVNYDDIPAIVVPLQQLEDLAPNTWYINVLATYPRYRGRGHGTGLLSIAEQLAIDSGKTGTSLIVSDANVGAIQLYERQGYAAIASRPMIKESWQNPGVNWVLLRKEFQATVVF